MLQLLAGTFAFFWTHTALWFYREYKERKERKSRPHVKTDELLEGKSRASTTSASRSIWRIAHLTFALSLMILTLTGMSVLYADTAWAPVVMHWLGGPKVAAVIHRTFAVLFATVFFVQLIYFVMRIGRNWRTLRLVRTQLPGSALAGSVGHRRHVQMVLRPGAAAGVRSLDVLGEVRLLGAVLGRDHHRRDRCHAVVPNVTATFLPGWAFNVATIFHGEEALLAALFLFTVHFFNNHFRPDKFPLDVVMFTGSMPLEEFRHEHTVEYNRLVAAGELEKYLVDAPSEPMTLGSKILGFTLIAFGLLLLVFVLIGMFSGVNGA